ncbi:MAG: Rcs stress response system protein RcsF [Enterobacteriaceae bacterium]
MMRILPLCVLTVVLAGCSVVDNGSGRGIPTNQMPAKMYKSADELAGKNYSERGQVSGSSCQPSPQDPPASISEARQDMLVRANRLNANAVILDSCETTSGMAGCYRQAICMGTAITVPSQ